MKTHDTDDRHGGPGAGTAMEVDKLKDGGKVDDLIDAGPEEAKRQVMQMTGTSDKVNIQVSTTNKSSDKEKASSTSQPPTGSAMLPVLDPVAKKIRISLPKGSGAPKLCMG